MSDLLERVAGAPITWGVDGSPGWGHLMGRERVLREMVESGLSATELGPDGYLPTDPGELREFLDEFWGEGLARLKSAAEADRRARRAEIRGARRGTE